jgi:hypothetical protein
VALACLSLAFLASVGAAVFNFAIGNHGEFWWFVVIFCVVLGLLTLQLRHVLRRGDHP